MTVTLLTTGLLCVIAAIAGGGVEALGGKVPVIQSSKRQMALGLFGMLLLLSAYVSSSSNVPPQVVRNESSSSELHGDASLRKIAPRQSDSGSSPVNQVLPAATAQVTDALIQPVNKAHPNLLGIQAVAHLENVGKVPITAGCPEATAIVQFLVQGPQGPQMTPNSWRLLGQQHYTPGQPCRVDLGVSESKAFPIYITFDKPPEDAISVNVAVQFHKDAIPFGTNGRDNSRVWSASAKARVP